MFEATNKYLFTKIPNDTFKTNSKNVSQIMLKNIPTNFSTSNFTNTNFNFTTFCNNQKWGNLEILVEYFKLKYNTFIVDTTLI